MPGRLDAYGKSQGFEEVIETDIENRGQPELTFEPLCCSLQVKGIDSEFIVFKPSLVQPRLPATIKHGQTIRLLTPVKGFKDALDELWPHPPYTARVRARDAISREFFSEWHEITF